MSDLSPLSGAKLKSDFGAVRAAFDPERPCGLRAACRVLPARLHRMPARLHLIIVLAATPARIAGLGRRIGLKKEAEAVVVPALVARNENIDRRPSHHEPTPGLAVQPHH